MIPVGSPIVSILRGDQAEALLVRNSVGRLAFSYRDRVDLEPIHYVYEAPWIYGRTSRGAKLLTLEHNTWCAFEVDEVEGIYDWRSVVVKGPFSTSDTSVSTWNRETALSALRRLVPTTLTDLDPTPHRSVLFAIHATEISGRSSEGAVVPATLDTAAPWH